MLSLTRKVKRGHESTIVINGNTRVTVESIKGNQVKLSIDAPKDVVVDREEIHLKKLRDRE